MLLIDFTSIILFAIFLLKKQVSGEVWVDIPYSFSDFANVTSNAFSQVSNLTWDTFPTLLACGIPTGTFRPYTPHPTSRDSLGSPLSPGLPENPVHTQVHNWALLSTALCTVRGRVACCGPLCASVSSTAGRIMPVA